MLKIVEQLNSWLDEQILLIHEEKYFLYILGGLFLLGIVTKWMVMKYYGRLNRKAENMNNPKSVVLRQIKMKFEGIKQVNGTVTSPVLLVKRHLNKCRVGLLSVKRLNYFINICAIGAVFAGIVMGIKLYIMNYDKDIVFFYMLAGGLCGFILEVIDRNVHVGEMREELACTIVDFMENNMAAREQRTAEKQIDSASYNGENTQNVESKVGVVSNASENNYEQDKKYQEEQIINQVIGEYLQ